MTNDTLSSEITKIVTALQSQRENTITGARIGELILKIAPNMDMRTVMDMPSGTGVLSKFIDKYLSPTLTRSGKQGSDLVYTINTTDSTGLTEVNPSLWQTFVRPHSCNSLVIRDSTLKLVESAELKADQDEKRIQSVTDPELKNIQTKFMDTLQENSGDLPNISESYKAWTIGLRRIGEDHYKKWIEFRLHQLEELFSARLQALEISSELNEQLCSMMRHSRLAAKSIPLAQKTKTSETQVANAALKSPSLDLELNFRSVISEVIQNLSISDLREIKLPCGAIFDAIINQRNK